MVRDGVVRDGVVLYAMLCDSKLFYLFLVCFHESYLYHVSVSFSIHPIILPN